MWIFTHLINSVARIDRLDVKQNFLPSCWCCFHFCGKHGSDQRVELKCNSFLIRIFCAESTMEFCLKISDGFRLPWCGTFAGAPNKDYSRYILYTSVILFVYNRVTILNYIVCFKRPDCVLPSPNFLSQKYNIF